MNLAALFVNKRSADAVNYGLNVRPALVYCAPLRRMIVLMQPNLLKGALLLLLAEACFAGIGALVKLTSDSASHAQVVFFRNFFGVHASQPLSVWQHKGWIHADDPRGWFQWYCRYYMGRRTADDARQIRRWRAIARHVSAIRKHCERGDLASADQLLRRLQRDSRLGAQKLYKTLTKRFEEQGRERRRLRAAQHAAGRFGDHARARVRRPRPGGGRCGPGRPPRTTSRRGNRAGSSRPRRTRPG